MELTGCTASASKLDNPFSRYFKVALSGRATIISGVAGDIPSVADFYDGLASDYHLVYGRGWDAAVERWGEALDALIRPSLQAASAVLDCSCGIGTQAIGLARRGYRVRATDISPGAIERARREAARLGAAVSFDVADFRDLGGIPGSFDVVISCDNAIPHLMTEREVTDVLAQMKARLRPGGVVLITMRDFDRALKDKPPMAPSTLIAGPPRRVLLRIHDWDPAGAPFYTLRLLVLTQAANGWSVVEHTTRYRAVTREELARAAGAVGFAYVVWRDADGVVPAQQQVMMATNPA